MATILATRAAIVSAIEAAVPALRSCAAYHGSVDPRELRKIASKLPAVLVSCMGSDDAELQAHEVVAPLRWGIFVLCGGPDPGKRNDEALAIINSLMLTIPGNDWGLNTVSNPSNVTCQNLFTDDVGMTAVSLWLVSFTQPVDLEAAGDVGDLDDFLLHVTSYDLEPEDGTEDMEARVEFEP